ncbi:hypothetical protein [Sphingobacterium siyangense]|uniref:hypothetical protein n=1 Tax=Sphingobacterium siyangense TaxID=459529 RepID=UPI003DA5658A
MPETNSLVAFWQAEHSTVSTRVNGEMQETSKSVFNDENYFYLLFSADGNLSVTQKGLAQTDLRYTYNPSTKQMSWTPNVIGDFRYTPITILELTDQILVLELNATLINVPDFLGSSSKVESTEVITFRKRIDFQK